MSPISWGKVTRDKSFASHEYQDFYVAYRRKQGLIIVATLN